MSEHSNSDSYSLDYEVYDPVEEATPKGTSSFLIEIIIIPKYFLWIKIPDSCIDLIL